MNGADPERTGPRPPAEPSVRRSVWRPVWRRRRATAGWVCAVVLAALLGVWSFQYGTPGARYTRHEPLDDDRVQRELAAERGSQPTAGPTARPTTETPTQPATEPTAGTTDPATAPDAPRTATVHFPGDVATATVECRPDHLVRLLNWSPSDGYSADEVESGPAREVTVELEPPDDDADSRTFAVRCHGGEPEVAVSADDEDDDD
ncbi:hypothetical protein [Streptomyces sp. Amel2xB2]|uniref:hypothetical protein n=1 Tax=Streptomyces sp. Amel2xB2 TaxID=1305829 RepID=UPI0011B93994|nr:hypothetical protein [Streptomyces sp. Amel2xB2]